MAGGAPTSPPARRRVHEIGQETSVFDGAEVPTRPTLGIFTQPLSFIGLPIVSVPVPRDGALPVGVQVVAAPWNERAALRVAAALETMGIAAAPVATPHRGAGT